MKKFSEEERGRLFLALSNFSSAFSSKKERSSPRKRTYFLCEVQTLVIYLVCDTHIFKVIVIFVSRTYELHIVIGCFGRDNPHQMHPEAKRVEFWVCHDI